MTNNTTKIFYAIYIELLEEFDQISFVNNFCCFLNKFKFTEICKIKNIKHLIYNLKYDYLLAYKVCMLAYIKCEMYNKISKFITFDNNEEKKINDVITNEYSTLCNDYLYINTFDYYVNGQDVENENATVVKENIKTWENATKNIMIENLIYLVKYFSLEKLKLMGVKLITYEDATKMNFNEMSKYYNKQIVKINKNIGKKKEYCYIFIKMHETLLLTLNTFDNKIDFSDLKINIEVTNIENNMDDIQLEINKIYSNYLFNDDV